VIARHTKHVTAFWTEVHRDVVHVTGDDSLTYLQSQISQDIRGLAVGASAYSFVLQPIGKIDALIRIARVADQEFVIDTDHGYGEPLMARLNRFKIRVKVDIAAVQWRCISVRHATESVAHGVPAWGATDAFDLIGPDPHAPAGVREGSSAELELARIGAGWPAMGNEITDATIPAETGVVAQAVNFTKGCYPGQELVERMDSRGSQAPRFVRRIQSSTPLNVGDEVTSAAAVVGRITSSAQQPESGEWLALASIARSVQPSAVVQVHGHDVTVLAARALEG
jgi:folate-binding protein YgfZ